LRGKIIKLNSGGVERDVEERGGWEVVNNKWSDLNNGLALKS